MKTPIVTILLGFLSTVAFAAPNVVDCTNTSSPLVVEGTGQQGFGITYNFPEKMVVVQDFLYEKASEKAWMKVIVDGFVYLAVGDCRRRIKRGVSCSFDVSLEAHGSIKNIDAPPLTNYMESLFGEVIDTNIEDQLVKVTIGMNHKSSHPTLAFLNMIDFDNSWIGNCKSKETLEQG